MSLPYNEQQEAWVMEKWQHACSEVGVKSTICWDQDTNLPMLKLGFRPAWVDDEMINDRLVAVLDSLDPKSDQDSNQ